MPATTRTEALMSRIGRHPRLKLGHFPTAIEPLPRLSRKLGGASLFAKRDDATGMGQGGNKVRALEFIIPDARRANADILLTAGVVQSNSVRQVAAAAAKAGLDCHFGMITDRVGKTDPDYAQTGNILLDHLYGATHEIISINDDRADVLARMADRFRSEGRRPYIVPYGCANRLGAMGYLNAALEISDQIAAQEAARELEITHLVHATGTGGTQAGLIVGFAALGLPIEIIGVDIDADPIGVKRRVTTILRELADEVGLKAEPLERKIIIESRYSAGAYGQADAATIEAISMAAGLEALTLDPVYSGKAFAALIGLSREGRFKDSDNVLFLHTGGTPALYAYRSLFGFGA
jgi:L-cysteate sulfo-lyase